MAWNTPGDQNSDQDKNRDPWKENRSGGNRPGNEFEKWLDDLSKKFNNFFDGNGKGPENFFSNIPLLLLGLAALWLASGFYILDEKERGVVLRLGKFHSIQEPGLRWKANFVDTVKVINVTEIRSLSHNALILTEDGNIVDVDVSAQYRVTNPKDYWLEVRDSDGTLKDALESALRHVMGQKKMDIAISKGREEVKVELAERLQAYLDKYKTGITIDEINVEDIQPPDAVQAAFDDVEKADQERDQIIDQAEAYYNKVVPEARGQAKRLVQEAQAYREKIIAESEGEADRFTKLLTEYKKAPKVTRERLYLETVGEVMNNTSKVMVDVKGGNNMMYLPLDQIAKQQPAQRQMTTEQVKRVLQQTQQSLPQSSRIERSVRGTR